MFYGSFSPFLLLGTAKIRSEKENQAHKNSGAEETMRVGFGNSPRDFFRAIKYLTLNPTFTFTVLGGVGDALLINSFGAFLPKFFESQFGITASLATILTGKSCRRDDVTQARTNFQTVLYCLWCWFTRLA